MKGNKKSMFNLQEVKYEDLDKQLIPVSFDQKDFANALFANAQSIEMDNFAREIHTKGEAEINDSLAQELIAITAPLYKRRVVQALKETLENLK